MGDAERSAPFGFIEEDAEGRRQFMQHIREANSGEDVRPLKRRRSSSDRSEEKPAERSGSEHVGHRTPPSPTVVAAAAAPPHPPLSPSASRSAVASSSSATSRYTPPATILLRSLDVEHERPLRRELDQSQNQNQNHRETLDAISEEQERHQSQHFEPLREEINDTSVQRPSAVTSAPSTVLHPYIQNFTARPGPLLDAGPPGLWTGTPPPRIVAADMSRSHQREARQPQVESEDENEHRRDGALRDDDQEGSSCAHKKPFRLLDLPAEIRDLIYSYVLIPERKSIHDAFDSYVYDLSTFRTCKQVSSEAVRQFRLQNIFVRIETPWHQAEQHASVDGRVPVLAAGELADKFASLHFRIMIEAPEMMHNGGLSKFVIRLEDLVKFCTMWYYSDLTHIGLNNHLALKIIVQDPNLLFPALRGNDANPKRQMPRWAQEELFRPFGMIKDLYSVKVEGAYEADIVQKMKDNMAIPYDTPEQCLEEAERLKNVGNEELKQGRYEAAIEQYTKAFASIHILVDGRRRTICGDAYFEKDLRGGMFDRQHGGIARMVMRIKLVANAIQAYLKLERWADAHFWGMRSINLMREALGGAADTPRPAFPAAAEWGKIYYRTGLAAKHLDLMSDAREMFSLANMWLPGNAMVQKEVAATALRLG